MSAAEILARRLAEADARATARAADIERRRQQFREAYPDLAQVAEQFKAEFGEVIVRNVRKT